ncbi:hypothetical protein WUBG_16128 [Wuchereria bancrofti]|uniref:Uncharacterized protein n=1 Tax=Wuchereria bancrofti TaxID=6293 RepID=J9DTI4_WUCBA|nr:hypothetical protein WUBG_16128 [Wuchereria bancrofti]
MIFRLSTVVDVIRSGYCDCDSGCECCCCSSHFICVLIGLLGTDIDGYDEMKNNYHCSELNVLQRGQEKESDRLGERERETWTVCGKAEKSDCLIVVTDEKSHE